MTTPLFALANTLINGILTLESVYAKNGTSFPSLDEPFVPNALDNDAVLAATTRLIVGAAAQIIATVRPPVETLQDYALSMYTPATLGLAVDCNFADVLESVGPKGLHSRDIAQKVGLEEEKTAHVLRYLATRHVFREVAPNVFASNRLSSVLCKGSSMESIKEDPVNQYEGAPVAASIAHFCDEGLRGSSAIASWVKDPKGYTSPANMAFDTKLPLFEWFEQPGNEWRIQRFTAAMKGATSRFKLESFTSALGRLSLRPDDVVVDVGGNVGMLSLNMLTAYPHLRFVVQDLPNVILGAEQYWRTNNPEALAEKRVTLQAHSFFDLQPVQNAAVYFMRAILHDWPTTECITILKNIRQAAGPTSKLLVFEHILPLACAETSTEFDVTDDTIPAVPWPMLPNLGVGLGAWVTALDMQMMNLLNGQERTVAQFAELGAATGWKLESVKPGGMAAFIYSAA